MAAGEVANSSKLTMLLSVSRTSFPPKTMRPYLAKRVSDRQVVMLLCRYAEGSAKVYFFSKSCKTFLYVVILFNGFVSPNPALH
jgi:hypothetical protein